MFFNRIIFELLHSVLQTNTSKDRRLRLNLNSQVKLIEVNIIQTFDKILHPYWYQIRKIYHPHTYFELSGFTGTNFLHKFQHFPRTNQKKMKQRVSHGLLHLDVFLYLRFSSSNVNNLLILFIGGIVWDVLHCVCISDIPTCFLCSGNQNLFQ